MPSPVTRLSAPSAIGSAPTSDSLLPVFADTLSTMVSCRSAVSSRLFSDATSDALSSISSGSSPGSDPNRSSGISGPNPASSCNQSSTARRCPTAGSTDSRSGFGLGSDTGSDAGSCAGFSASSDASSSAPKSAAGPPDFSIFAVSPLILSTEGHHALVDVCGVQEGAWCARYARIATSVLSSCNCLMPRANDVWRWKNTGST